MTLSEHARQLLGELMDHENVSCRELSKRSGVADTTILRILKGERDPSLSTLETIFAGLGVELVLDVRPA